MAIEGLEQRKLAAIMFTDMVGYSALAQRDEELALELLDEHRPSHTSPGVRSQMAIAQSAPTRRRPSASTACSRRRTSATPAPKRESTSGSRLMSGTQSRQPGRSGRAGSAATRCPRYRRGTWYCQTVSFELISDLAVLEPQYSKGWTITKIALMLV
jgi:hypothetical protein